MNVVRLKDNIAQLEKSIGKGIVVTFLNIDGQVTSPKVYSKTFIVLTTTHMFTISSASNDGGTTTLFGSDEVDYR